MQVRREDVSEGEIGELCQALLEWAGRRERQGHQTVLKLIPMQVPRREVRTNWQ